MCSITWAICLRLWTLCFSYFSNFPAESREGSKNQMRPWNKNLPNEKHLYQYFWKEHSVFSQWYSCTFTVDEQTYSSAEQYMMHQKAGKSFFYQEWQSALCLFCCSKLKLLLYHFLLYKLTTNLTQKVLLLKFD